MKDLVSSPEETDNTPAVPAAAVPAPAATLPIPVPVSSIPEGFALFDDGIYEMPENDSAAPVFVCTPLRVDASFSDTAGKGWGKVVAVRSRDGQWHDVPVLNRDLGCRSSDILGQLLDHGLELGRDKKSKERLLALLRHWKPQSQMTSVTRMGWVPDGPATFVIGNDVIGARNVFPMLGSGAASTQSLRVSGSLESWRSELGEKCRGNHMMLLAASLAFSGPLLALTGMSGGGLHFRGSSSSGKTTLMHLAASVWGSRELIHQWRATSNGLEGVAVGMNDMLLAVDEIGEIAPRALHEAIYMLANGTGKARMNTDAVLKDTGRWRLALISSGEMSVEEKLKEAKLTAMAGQEVRLIDIEADGRAHGVFDDLHGAACAAEFADSIKAATQISHGAVGHEFIRMLVASKDHISEIGTRYIRNFGAKAVSSLAREPDGISHRVAQRFGLLALAGELATMMKLTGWEKGEARSAALGAFRDWHDRQFGDRIDQISKVIQPMQNFLATRIHELTDIGKDEPVGGGPGWKDDGHVYLKPETWLLLFPDPMTTAAAKAMLGLDMLLPGDGGRQMRKAPHAIPGRPRLYTVHRRRVMAFKSE
ncbi:DUF927 domain-containing protein [Rhodobacter sp. Har01]|uniref:DUF927 domain-containing protein n=1 Tax=Rhodobacter sp. Har01 TaxID=2883999 RepID=UPI001D060AA2|nr:DUF927 domain-containing protein [Rhodobacter sp. Har01]MCB6179033.1 DUF927 domain-containing protein [Rhodobacter sp. Har01]